MTEKLSDPKKQEALLHAVNKRHYEMASFGDRMADRFVGIVGSWKFLIVQTVVVSSWVALNVMAIHFKWDPYPFILLNLLFSTQAAYSSPLILLAGKRSAERDRLTLEHTARETELDVQKTEELLTEVLNNTELTNKILEHLQKGSENNGRRS